MPRLRECLTGDNESLRGGFIFQFRCPKNRGIDLETCVLQRTGNFLHAVPIAGERQVCAVRICSVDRLTLRLKRKQHVTPRYQDPRQFVECFGEPIRRSVDDGVPAHSTREFSRLDRKCIELTFFEFDVRMCGPSDGKHRRGHVHADDIEATFRHESRHSAWPTPDVGDASDRVSLDQLDEGHEQRPVDRAFCGRADLSAYELDIPRHCSLVDRSGGCNMVLIGHPPRLCV